MSDTPKTRLRGPDHTDVTVSVWSNEFETPPEIAKINFDMDVEAARTFAAGLLPALRPGTNVTLSWCVQETYVVEKQ